VLYFETGHKVRAAGGPSSRALERWRSGRARSVVSVWIGFRRTLGSAVLRLPGGGSRLGGSTRM
jgi:hypothetical protein